MGTNMDVLEAIDEFPVVTPTGIDSVREIVTGHSALSFKWNDGKGKVVVDVVTANMLCTVYDAANDKTKEIINTLIAKSRHHFIKAVDTGWKVCK